MKTAFDSVTFGNITVKLSDLDLKRFWEKVSVSGDNDCWIWNGAKDFDGYGIFQIRRRARKAHRVSWMLFNGSIPNGLSMCHKCDVPGCVNPSHLFPGTTLENQQDSAAKGRRKGELHGQSFLRVVDILEIRRLRAAGLKHKDIAPSFGCSKANIAAILQKRTWSHVP